MSHTPYLFALAGWIYAIAGFAVLAWLSNRSELLDRYLTHENPWINTGSLLAGLVVWPFLAVIALPALWTRSGSAPRAPY